MKFPSQIQRCLDTDYWREFSFNNNLALKELPEIVNKPHLQDGHLTACGVHHDWTLQHAEK